MKIVQVCPYDLDRPGGVQKHILALANELKQRGHDVAIVAPGPSPEGSQPGRYYAGRKKLIGFSGTRFEITHIGSDEKAALLGELASWGAEVFHFHTPWTPAMQAQLFTSISAARVATFHDTPPDTLSGDALRLMFKMMSRWFLNRLDGAIAVSEAPAAHLWPGNHGVKPKIIPPAVDLSRFAALADSGRETGDECFRVLFVGRLEPRKGAVSLIEAWQLLQQRLAADATPRLELVIAGEGPLRPQLESMAEAAPAKNIRFEVAPDEKTVIALMQQSDVFVAPSLYGESFGIVLVEAMSAGVPVVAAANRGYATVLRGGGEQWLYPPGDAVALADRLAALVQDDAARLASKVWGLEHAIQFDVAQVAPRFEAVFEGALALRSQV